MSYWKFPLNILNCMCIIVLLIGALFLNNTANADENIGLQFAQAKKMTTVSPMAEPIVKPGELIAVNKQKDKCFNKGPDGKLVEVKCPDVIVAVPKKPSGASEPIESTEKLVARKARTKEFVPRGQIKGLGAQVALGGGAYNCYKEDPPNSGNFKRVKCPDVIVLEPGKE
jgi:hypothetical protein